MKDDVIFTAKRPGIRERRGADELFEARTRFPLLMHQRQKLVGRRLLNENDERFVFALIKLVVTFEGERLRGEAKSWAGG